MFNWYKKVVFENYANFEGRARRKEFWYFLLLHYIILIIVSIIDRMAGLTIGSLGYGILYLVYAFAALIPSLAVQARRLHDVGKSGWYMLIPIYNIILFCTEGDNSENEYGPDPKGDGDEIHEIGTKEE